MTVSILLFMFIGLNAEAENAERAQALRDQISALSADVARLEDNLARMREDSHRLSDEIGRLELRRAVITKHIEKSELELRGAEDQLALNEAKQLELSERAANQQAMLSRRLRNLYKRGSLGYAQIFLKQSRLTDLINAYHYAKVLTERDHRILRDFQETLSQLKIVEEALVNIRAEKEATTQRLAEQETALKELIRKRNRRLREIKRESSRQNKLLEELELEKEELDLMVRRLIETNADPLALRVPITRYRGKLNWPAQGKVRRKFGIYRDPEFRTKRKQNGIDIGVAKGRNIRAVYSGRVIFADWFKNYGNLVIIDHNQKITSFYAHCDRLLVQKGDIVERDAVIAVSGDTGSLDGPLLHFEIRNKTVPENPLKWLKP